MTELFDSMGWTYKPKDGVDRWVWSYGPCRLDVPHKSDDECPRPRSVFECYAVDQPQDPFERSYWLYRDGILIEARFDDDGDVQDRLMEETGLDYDSLRDAPLSRRAWEKAKGTVTIDPQQLLRPWGVVPDTDPED